MIYYVLAALSSRLYPSTRKFIASAAENLINLIHIKNYFLLFNFILFWAQAFEYSFLRNVPHIGSNGKKPLSIHWFILRIKYFFRFNSDVRTPAECVMGTAQSGLINLIRNLSFETYCNPLIIRSAKLLFFRFQMDNRLTFGSNNM